MAQIEHDVFLETSRQLPFVDGRHRMIHPSPVMTNHRTSVVLSGVLGLLCCFSLVACGGSQKKPEHQDDKLVPEETQERSRDQYGQQQMRMDELGMTTSEQSGARHENATRPVESEKYGKKKEKKRR